MSTSSYTANKLKLRKIVTAVQSAITDLEQSITNTEVIIQDFKTFKHSTSDDPRLVDPLAILPLSNLAAIQCFTTVYENQVKVKHQLIRVIDLACGKNNEQTANEFAYEETNRLRSNCLFSRPFIPLPLEVTATSSTFFYKNPESVT